MARRCRTARTAATRRVSCSPLKTGEKVYLACDTGLFGDMRLIGEEGLDLAVLPIGDNYTMGPDDALRAVKLLTAKARHPGALRHLGADRPGPAGVGQAGRGGDRRQSPCFEARRELFILVEVKMLDSFFRRKESEQRFVQEGRLPPGQSTTQKFPVCTTARFRLSTRRPGTCGYGARSNRKCAGPGMSSRSCRAPR